MKYIKDFFYNLSDLIIILLILGLAGGLIYWRVNVILDYPKVLAAEVRESGNQLVPEDVANADTNADADANANADANADADANGDANGAANANANANSDADAEEGADSNKEDESNKEPATVDTSTEQEPGSGPRDNTIWKDGKLRVDMNVELASGSSEGAVESLVQAGLFASYDDYIAVCERNNLDPDMVRALEYTFPAGSTQDDIAKAVTIE